MPSEATEVRYRASTLVIWYIVFTVICTVIAFLVGPESWGILKMVFAGGLGGALSFLCVFANHVLLL